MGEGWLRDTLLDILEKLSEKRYNTDNLVFQSPASDADVNAVEQELGFLLPQSFRAVLTTVTRHIEFSWSAPDNLEYPDPFRSNFSGELKWSICNLAELEAKRRNWAEGVFSDQDDEYNQIWHKKLAFQEVANGDLIAIDLRPEKVGEIVYLSHDYGKGHGAVLAKSFSELLKRWVPLACAGAEDWQWLPFLEAEVGLNPDAENGVIWRKLLALY